MKTKSLPFLLALTFWCAHGATISTSVTCSAQNNPTTYQAGGPGVPSANCSAFGPWAGDPHGFYSSASAGVSISSSSVGLSAITDEFHGGASAIASYSSILTLTVLGGTGTGYLLPIDFTADPGAPNFHGSTAYGSFSGTALAPPGSPCLSFIFTIGPPQGQCLAFTFGQANTYNLSLNANSNQQAFVTAHFNDSFAFWDSQGNRLTNVQYTLTGLALPEPASWSLMLLGIAVLGGIARFRIS